MIRARAIAKSFLIPLLLLAGSCGESTMGPQGVPGPEGMPGPAGPAGAVPPVPAALTLIWPQAAFPDRAVTVQVAGSLTHFGPTSKLQFSDPEITVTKLTVTGPASLRAELRLSAKAKVGAVDLWVQTTVQDPSGMSAEQSERVQLQSGFLVAPSLSVDAASTSKSTPQGGLMDFAVRNLDRDNPFAVGNAPSLDGGAVAVRTSLLGNRLLGVGLIDALAPVGGLPLRARFGSIEKGLSYSLDPAGEGAPQVTARAAVELISGTAKLGERFMAAKQSNLYKVTTTADEQLLFLAVTTEGGLTGNALFGAVAPASGRFAEGQAFYSSSPAALLPPGSPNHATVALLPKRGDSYVALFPAGLGSGADWGYSVLATVAPAKAVSAKEAMADTPLMPLVDVVLDSARYAVDAAMDGPADLDYVRIKATKSGRLLVQAVTPGLRLSDPGVSVTLLQADCTAPLAAARPVQQEAVVTAGTTYCALISSLAGYAGGYQLLVAHDP